VKAVLSRVLFGAHLDREGAHLEGADASKALVVPLLAEELKYLPLPILEGSTDDYDYRLENLVLNGYQVPLLSPRSPVADSRPRR
jgi:hypothetical protein